MFLLLLSFVSCTDQNTLEHRLENFYQFLDPTTIADFEAGKLNSGVEYIERKLVSDETYAEKFNEMKKNEAIELFENDQILYYYYQFFYQQIKKKNQK